MSEVVMNHLSKKLPELEKPTREGEALLAKEKTPEGLTPDEQERLRQAIVDRAATINLSDFG